MLSAGGECGTIKANDKTAIEENTMKDTMLRLPAQCAALTPEEQLLVEGGDA